MEELEAELKIDINTDVFLKLSSDEITCESWFFVDNRNDRSFDKQDFYFAYCDKINDNDKMLFIYRGHHLYAM